MSLDDLEYRLTGRPSVPYLLQQSQLVAPDGSLRPLARKSLADQNVHPLPRWPIGLHSDFDVLFGGGSGLTIIAGPSGAGKSVLALACALENAVIPGTCVCYIDGENAQGDQIARAANWFGSPELAQSNLDSMGLQFAWFEMEPDQNYGNIMAACAARWLLNHERLLLILDSVSAMSRFLPGRQLENLSKLWVALHALVRRSEGRISVLALSELNEKGGVKGLEGVYVSTMALALARELDEGDDIVRLSMVKNRSGRFQRDLGLYRVNESACRLERFHHGEARDRPTYGAH